MRNKRRNLYNAARGFCAYCDRLTDLPSLLSARHTELTATIDHIIPLSRGGTNRIENLRLACAACNGRKGDMLPDEWAAFMRKHPGWWKGPPRPNKQRRAPARPAPPPSAVAPRYVPIAYPDDHKAQAAFEAVYIKRKGMLRVPIEPYSFQRKTITPLTAAEIAAVEARLSRVGSAR